jgi:hypothetical protein
MIEIKLSFASFDEAIKFLADQGIKHDPVIEKTTSAIVESQEPIKKTRKKNSVVGNAQPEVAGNAGSIGEVPSRSPLPSDDADEVEGDTTVRAAPQPIVNADAVREALKAYNGKYGMDKARELLKEFGAARITELKESEYSDFIEAASVAV